MRSRGRACLLFAMDDGGVFGFEMVEVYVQYSWAGLGATSAATPTDRPAGWGGGMSRGGLGCPTPGGGMDID